jgi:hypothetical protein
MIFYKDLDEIAGPMLLGSTRFIGLARLLTDRCSGKLVTQFSTILAAIDGLSYHFPLKAKNVEKASVIVEYFS